VLELALERKPEPLSGEVTPTPAVAAGVAAENPAGQALITH